MSTYLVYLIVRLLWSFFALFLLLVMLLHFPLFGRLIWVEFLRTPGAKKFKNPHCSSWILTDSDAFLFWLLIKYRSSFRKLTLWLDIMHRIFACIRVLNSKFISLFPQICTILFISKIIFSTYLFCILEKLWGVSWKTV